MDYFYIKNDDVYKMDHNLYEIVEHHGVDWVESKWHPQVERYIAHQTANEAWQVLAYEATQKLQRIKDNQFLGKFKS